MTAPNGAVLARDIARDILRRRARSFSWAARLLPADLRADATALYAWCRRCDDAVDDAPDAGAAREALARLRTELDGVYGGAALADPVLAGFQDLARRRALPRGPADELLDGMAMDLGRVRYATFDDLLVYCHRVAGTVGLLMAHLMGVRDPGALRRADDLGIAMQLTNICRDVVEDERRDRVYLPAELLGGGLPSEVGPRTRAAVSALLARADGYYRSGDAGLPALPAACAGAIRAARLIYADIGRVLARRGFDVWAGRAVVSPARKLWLAARALVETAAARLVGWRTA
jgi:phytoene synthase